MSHVLNSEVFLIPDESQEDNYLVFAPLRNAVVRATGEQVNLLAKLKQGLDDVEPWAQDLLADLTSAGLVNGPPEELPATFEGADYAPTRGTLLISNRCDRKINVWISCPRGHWRH